MVAEKDVDVDELEPIDEDDPDRSLLVCGYTFGEVLAITNGFVGFCLAYMSVFGKSPTRYEGKSFVGSCLTEWFGSAPGNNSVLSTSVFVPFIGHVLDRFFKEAASTVGGSLVMDSLFTLYAGVTLSALLEASRRNVVNEFGWKGKLFAACFPVFCQIIGICVVYPFFLAWMWSNQRGFRRRLQQNKVDNLPQYDVDPRRVALSCASALLILGLQFGLLGAGQVPEQRKFTEQDVVLFLCLPMLPALLFLLLPTMPPAYSRGMRKLAGAASVLCFLIIGAAGFGIHSYGFSQFEQELKKNGGESTVNLIVKDALSSAPSRFLFVEFVHLALSCLLFCAISMSGTGGVGLIWFVTAIVGPAGSFGLLAAHHEFRMMKEDNLI